MTLKQLSAKLRHAADTLDDLIGIERITLNETPRTAEKIRATFKPQKKARIYQA